MFLGWSPDDQDKVVQYLIWKSKFCPVCNTHNEGWVDERKRMLDEPEYEVITHKCFGCEEKERMRDVIPDDAKGVYVAAVKRKMGTVPEIDLREERAERERLEGEQRMPPIPTGGYYT